MSVLWLVSRYLIAKLLCREIVDVGGSTSYTVAPVPLLQHTLCMSIHGCIFAPYVLMILQALMCTIKLIAGTSDDRVFIATKWFLLNSL